MAMTRFVEGPSRFAALSASLLVASVMAACAKPHLIVSPIPPDNSLERPVARVTEHVIVVSIDGLRPDAIARYKAKTLGRLVAEGSYTLRAQTILPSKTLPSHTSMLTGEPPERHGILWNTAFSDAPGTIEIPTIFGLARARGYETAAFFSKAKFSHLQRAGTLDYSQAPGGWFGRWSAAQTVSDVERHLAQSKPGLLFVHLPDPDVAGHAAGWMSPRYGQAVLRADAAVARLLTAADSAYGAGEYTIIVTADHGGHDKDHGSDDPLDVTIPWIAWGRGVTPGELTGKAIHTMDTASTALFLLGVDAPSGWVGTPVRTAFHGAVATQ
jgi:predicted AlkP superfamily pyrophosphatase or phosphodiesterase